MNTYHKLVPNVYLAKCSEEYQKEDVIELETKYGKINECIVHNLYAQKDGYFYYSITRADGFDAQERAKNKAEKYSTWSDNAAKRSNTYYKASEEGKDFLSLGEPIKVGHHSEGRHRALIERNDNRMRKCIEEDKKSEILESKAEYWRKRENDINLSMPESLQFYEFKLEIAKENHKGLKDGSIPRTHSFSLTYANKEVKELEKKVEIAKKLWS